MRVKSLVVDAGPLIEYTRSELLAHAEKLITTSAVFAEIRDPIARRKLESLPELSIKEPSKEAVSFVERFSAQTGDKSVLSGADLGILALAYDFHDKKNLRDVQPSMNVRTIKVIQHGKPTPKVEPATDDQGWTVVGRISKPELKSEAEPEELEAEAGPEELKAEAEAEAENKETIESENAEPDLDPNMEALELSDDDDDWITPLNVNREGTSEPVNLEAALVTRDFAMQNVALQIGLSLVDSHGLQISKLRSYTQRCHACYYLAPPGGEPRKFCPRCGGHTLVRVTISVENGELCVHLKANIQWKTRGDRYSIPSPQSQRARKQRHDNKTELYAEDQPEYLKAEKLYRRKKLQNEKLLDNWVSPGTAESSGSPFVSKQDPLKVRVGRGRKANEARKH